MNDANINKKYFNFNKVFNMLYVFLISTIIITICYIAYFTFSVHINSIGIFNGFINNIFDSIPIVGKLLNEYIKSLNLIDYTVLYDNVLSSAITAEAIYLFTLLGLLQLITLLCISKFKNKNDKVVYLYICIMITAVLILRKPNLPIILSTAYSNTLRSLNMTLNISLAIQLLILLGIYYCYYKLYDKQHDSHSTVNNSLNKTQRYSKIMLTSMLVAFSVSLAFAQYKTVDIENVIITEYVIKVEKKLNKQIVLIIPKKVVDFGYQIGLKVNDKIDLGDMLHKNGLDNIDISKILSTYIINITNTGRNNMITTPLYAAIISIFLVVILYAIRIYERRISNNSISIALAGLLFSVLLFFFVSKFGYITALLAAPTVLIYLINIMYLIKQSFNYNKQAKVNI